MIVRLFIKPGCPWCDEALEWLAARSICHETLDVTNNSAARRQMLDLTGQAKAPCIEVDGHVLADFGVDELEEWWKKMKFAA